MGDDTNSRALLEALTADPALERLGFVATCSGEGSVLVERGGHVRGIWKHRGKTFYWTDAGYTDPSYSTRIIASAVAHTIKVLKAR